MHIIIAMLNAPPARFIGSELMTWRLARALHARGHVITVLIKECGPGESWVHDGIRVQHRSAARPPTVDMVICHADFANRARLIARRYQAPLVAICHNALDGVRNNLERIPFHLVVVNSQSVRAELGAEGALVVNPPMRDDRQPPLEQGRPVLADRPPAA